jgi:carbon storage regulator
MLRSFTPADRPASGALIRLLPSSEEKVNPLGHPWRSNFGFDLQGAPFPVLSPEDGPMLVLARKCGEQIVIPEAGIVLTILQVRGERVRVGIEAPAEVAIHRREVWERIQKAAQPDAAEPSPSSTVCHSI